MSYPAERPPLPDQDDQSASKQEQVSPAAGKPESNSKKNQPHKKQKEKKEDKDKKPGKLRKQLMPIVIMLGLIVGLFIAYSGVRAAREALGPQAPRTTTLPSNLGKIKLGYPEGWKQAAMQGVSGASGRWAMGTPGSTRYALFITRYPLRAVPKNDLQAKQVLLEAQSSLYQTGAAGNNLSAKRVEVAKQSSWYYHFSHSGTNIQIWLILNASDKKASLYQFSCQSPDGRHGSKMRLRCRQAIDGLRFP